MPFTVVTPLGVTESCTVEGVAGVFGRTFRLRVSRSFNAFCIFVSSNAAKSWGKDLIATPHFLSILQEKNWEQLVVEEWGERSGQESVLRTIV